MLQEIRDIRPETYALDALIRQSISRLQRSVTEKPADAMLFMGNWHHSFPALLVQDPVLEPVDKVVWMVICQQGRAAGTGTAFPSYNEIARQANIASTSTVSRAIAVLRATRWLSLCARVRDGGGRFKGNVYALHDEPLPLADTLHLDPEYMAFIKAGCQHHHARVRKVTRAILSSIDEDISEGVDVLAPVNVTERRILAMHALRQGKPQRYFSFTASVMTRLSNQRSVVAEVDRNQKSKPVNHRLRNLSPQKSKSVGSSSYIKTTTTTKTEDSKKTAREANEDPQLATLVYPRRLDDNQRAMAARYLAVVPPDQQQSVLDELEGRFQAEQQGAKPVYDELRYLHQLCAQVNSGGFLPNLSLKVQGERTRRTKEAEERRQQAQAEQQARRETAQPTRSGRGENCLAEMRRMLGLPPAK
ncbi:MAG TPA: STY4528 family pathogenicity island replication protein, partial [Gammaproteobacteria bacterium]|nr:STY4528 family pathogenicity island replication protein [Gammaproteobacteria bacterium]